MTDRKVEHASSTIPFRPSKAKRHAEVTLHFAPAPKPGGGAEYLKALDGLPKGWTLVRWNVAEPEDLVPPKHGEDLAAALRQLISEAQHTLDSLMDFAEVNSDDFGYLWDLERTYKAVQDAATALPDADDDDRLDDVDAKTRIA
jgi:hypothetical protein